MELLRHEPDVPPAEAVELGPGERAEILPGDRYPPLARPQQPAEDAEQRRLAAPRRPEHQPVLAHGRAPRIEREHLPVPVAVAEALDGDH